MTTLKFYARDDLLVLIPGSIAVPRNGNRYVGREWIKESRAYPATETGYTCDSKSPEGRRLIRLIKRDSSLFAANKETAELCGVEYIPVQFNAGAWTNEPPANYLTYQEQAKSRNNRNRT